MPNPHHRKKHKHFQPPPHERKQTKGGATSIMAIFGGVVGFAIVNFGIQGTTVWVIGGIIVGALVGLLIGRSMDRAPAKK